MRKYLLLIFLAFPALLIGCDSDDGDSVIDEVIDGNGDDKDDGVAETINVSVTVYDIADNHAMVSVSLSKGSFYGAMLVEAISRDTVAIDYTDEEQLINFVMGNGVEIDLPYVNIVTDLTADAEMLSAAIVFDADGAVADSAYVLWTAVGSKSPLDGDGNAGNLDEVTW